MAFADHYLQKQSLYPRLIADKPDCNLFQIVVIPCYKEPDLIKTLESLRDCNATKNPVEVIVVVNSSHAESDVTLSFNRTVFSKAENWALKNSKPGLKFYILNIENLPPRDAGVGLARKIGMDEAVRRFSEIENNNGIIVCFDADCTCDTNYLTEIENHFLKFPKTSACSIYFEHPLDEEQFSENNNAGIVQYELYLRYYMQALRFTGFPFSYHTIGSSFVVSVNTYIKQGGMNKRKAGEDFYFLQKVIPLGNYFEINSTRVIPSPRPSDRVPFGTGAAISKWLNNKNEVYFTYNLQSFIELKKFFEMVPGYYTSDVSKRNEITQKLTEGIRQFLVLNDFDNNLTEVISNSANEETFKKRFFRWFNAFKILKYANYSAEIKYAHVPVFESAKKLLEIAGIKEECNNPAELLRFYRKLERDNIILFCQEQ